MMARWCYSGLKSLTGFNTMTKNEIKSALRLQGHSLSSWAEARGYKPATVRRVLLRAFAGKVPKRGTGLNIWRALSEVGRE